MSEVVTGIGCKNCPNGARFICFKALVEKQDFLTSPEALANIWMGDEAPIWQTFQNDGEEMTADNQYANENSTLALCENGIREEHPPYDCPIDDLVERKIAELELAGYERITREA